MNFVGYEYQKERRPETLEEVEETNSDGSDDGVILLVLVRGDKYLYGGVNISLSDYVIKKSFTLRSAPALELNLVAVTTLLFCGSTAPTATSGVSTTATSLGGAVSMAARPYRTGK